MNERIFIGSIIGSLSWISYPTHAFFPIAGNQPPLDASFVFAKTCGCRAVWIHKHPSRHWVSSPTLPQFQTIPVEINSLLRFRRQCDTSHVQCLSRHILFPPPTKHKILQHVVLSSKLSLHPTFYNDDNRRNTHHDSCNTKNQLYHSRCPPFLYHLLLCLRHSPLNNIFSKAHRARQSGNTTHREQSTKKDSFKTPPVGFVEYIIPPHLSNKTDFSPLFSTQISKLTTHHSPTISPHSAVYIKLLW